MALFTWLWGAVTWLVKLVLPVFAKARDFRGISAGLRWALHLMLLGLILAGLAAANYYSGVGAALPTVGPLVQRYLWLPLLFLLVYILSWLGWWLWRLLGTDEDDSRFPDIDAAWEEAVAALHQAGIDPTDAPLFLVLGRPMAAEEALLKAAQVPLTVKQAPTRADAPLHVYGSRDAIYVTCSGASLLGRHAALLAGEREAGVDGAAPTGGGADEFDPGKTLRPSEKDEMRQMQLLLAKAEKEGRGPAQLLEGERRDLKILTRKSQSVPNLLKDQAVAGTLTDRLQHLCRLITRERRPYCPVNGLLLLVPYSGADDEAIADLTSVICQKEVSAARDALQIHCPMFALICDAETAQGFRSFIERFPEGERQRRVGQRFPLLPDVEEAAVPVKVQESVQWIGQSLIPYWAYKLFRVESKSDDDAAKLVEGNARMYQFMSEMRARSKRFGRIISRAAAPEKGGPPLFGGSYVGGTGTDPAGEQAFVAGVFRRLTDGQNAVSWTAEAVAEEADYLRWTRYGYVALLIFIAAVVGAGYFIWRNVSM
jgi:hypothetical protein